MKRFVLMALLLGGMAQTTFAQTDDIYATGEDQSKSANEQTDRKARRQQRRQNQQNGDPSRYDNGMYNQSGSSAMPDNYSGGYENGEDYVDYDDDVSYSTRLNRFDNDFYNMGYYSTFYNPYWYNRNWYDPYWGYNPWRPGISVGFGYGPYWNSSWGWNSWYGYGAWGSYWNYPSYACGWGTSPWWGWGGGGYYGGGYYNGYWNGFYDGSRYNYNNGYRNYAYGPRNAGYRTGGGYPYRSATVSQLGLRGASAGSGVNMYRGTNGNNVGRGWGSRGYSQQYNNNGNRPAQQGTGAGNATRQRGGFWRSIQGTDGSSWGGRSGIAQQQGGGTPSYGGGRASRSYSDGPARQQSPSFGGSRSFGGGNSGASGGSFGGRGGSSGGGGGARGGGGRR